MKHGSTKLLKIVVLFIGFAVLAALLWFPQTEGRAANLDLISIYTDPFILYVYLASTPFFVGLYQAFKLLNFIDANKAFSQAAVNTLKIMKLASLSLIVFIVLALLYIRFLIHGEDSAGVTMLGFVLSLAFGVIATATALFEKLFKNAAKLKSENDLIV